MTPCSSVSIVNFEKVNADWVMNFEILFRIRLIWGFQDKLSLMITPRNFIVVFCFISKLSIVTVRLYYMFVAYGRI